MKLIWAILFMIGAVPIVLFGYYLSAAGIIGVFAGYTIAIVTHEIWKEKEP